MKRAMLGGLVLAAAACAHEERKQVVVLPPIEKAVALPVPNAFVLGDPNSRSHAVAIALGPSGVYGLAIGTKRIVVGQGEPRIATEPLAEAAAGVAKIPRRFGGGFLFWTRNGLYRADAFAGALAPVANVPDTIGSVSFMPKAMLVRTQNGERWGITLPKGERAPIDAPLGVVDVEALDDGRAVAFSDQGTVFTSLDHGVHWTDATVQVRSAPNRVSAESDELWVYESNGGASRLERDGRLSWFEKAPNDAAFEVRAHDPRWHGSESPLRAVMHSGAAVDEATAIVIDAGNVVRVDVHTGELLAVVSGRLPPDAVCEAVPTPGDVLFACNAAGANASSFVVSHTLAGDGAQIEQSFGTTGRFYSGVDGALAFGGACQGAAANPDVVVCVRTPGGRWEERDLGGYVLPSGTTPHVARWVPRVDGRVIAIVDEPSLGIFDPATNAFQTLPDEARELLGEHGPSYHRKPKGPLKRMASSTSVDGAWSFTASGAVRGYRPHGGAFEISEDGKITHSPFTFDVKFAGAMALGRSADGRLYQSSDQGVSWTEVAMPPSGADGLDLAGCTTAGCDLGAFYRVGWPTHAPRIEPVSSPPAPASEVRRVRGLELACRPQSAPVVKIAQRTGESPEDLGLGASRLPIASSNGDVSYLRNVVPRGIVSPLREPPSSTDNDAIASVRLLLSGYATSREGDSLTVLGPNKNALGLRRALAFVAPFDPQGRIVRSAIAMSDVVAAGKRAGMTPDEILTDDFTESGTVVPLVSAEPAAPSEIAIHNVDHGLLTFVRGERTRVAVRPNANGNNVISGAITGPDEAAFLEVESSGVGHVFKTSSSGITELFDVSPTTNDSLLFANPDALAIGPKGELAVLRMPSGSDPASTFDRAFLVVPAMPPSELAPWSELRFADDPACKSEPGGYRAVLQLIAPWVRFTSPEHRADESPMLARVRWTSKRVCLEGFEVRVPMVSVRLPGSGGNGPTGLSTWIVARGSTFARVGIADGIEWRQPLECSVVSTGP